MAKKKVGKPPRKVKPAEMKKAEGYAYDWCRNHTIEGLMGWPNAFIEKHANIAKRLTKKRQQATADLRRAQREKAVASKDVTMMIWLGKNELGQADKTETKIDTGNIPAVIVVGVGTRDGSGTAKNSN